MQRANFGLCIDSWNIWQNPDVHEAIACGDRIFVVQLSDWRTPRSFLDRLSIGKGEIPFPALLTGNPYQRLHDGPYVVEIFSADVPDPLWQGDLESAYPRESRGSRYCLEGSVLV